MLAWRVRGASSHEPVLKGAQARGRSDGGAPLLTPLRPLQTLRARGVAP